MEFRRVLFRSRCSWRRLALCVQLSKPALNIASSIPPRMDMMVMTMSNSTMVKPDAGCCARGITRSFVDDRHQVEHSLVLHELVAVDDDLNFQGAHLGIDQAHGVPALAIEPDWRADG